MGRPPFPQALLIIVSLLGIRSLSFAQPVPAAGFSPEEYPHLFTASFDNRREIRQWDDHPSRRHYSSLFPCLEYDLFPSPNPYLPLAPHPKNIHISSPPLSKTGAR